MQAAGLEEDVRAWRSANERRVVGELADLLSIPNVADDVAAIERNADRLDGMLAARGFKVKRLSAGPGTPPSLFGELRTPGAKRTIVFYAHFDGQPVDQPGWISAPFTPELRAGPLGGKQSKIDWTAGTGPLDPEARLYARSASDDKGPIVAMLAALDALKASGRKPSVNLTVFLEGEEEQGSPNLAKILRAHKDLLKADVWIFADGPVHQSRRMQLVYGVRGVTGLELTVYGPRRPLHSGHYGNWAPNPAVSAARLVADLRDEEGRILVPSFYDDVRPLTAAEKAALAALPDVESALAQELALGRTEGGERLMDSVMRPALNVRGVSAGGVGEAAANAVPTRAQVSIDFRLVPGQTPEGVRRRIEAHLKAQGWFVTDQEPDAAVLAAHPRVVKAEWSAGYAATRTALDLPAARAVSKVVSAAVGEPVLEVPMLGGSLPVSIFTDTLGAPAIIVPMVNHDNNQHGVNENLRLQNLWDGIEVYAALFGTLDW